MKYRIIETKEGFEVQEKFFIFWASIPRYYDLKSVFPTLEEAEQYIKTINLKEAISKANNQ